MGPNFANSLPTLDAEPVLSPAEKAAVSHVSRSYAYAHQVRQKWLQECARARAELGLQEDEPTRIFAP